MLASDKTHLYYQGSGTQISYLRGNTVDYEYLDENGVRSTGTYQIAAIVTARETFLHRWLFMALVGFVFLILLGSMSLLALRLVEVVVVKPIDETNGVLGLSRLTVVTRFPGCQRGRLRQARP